MTIRNPDESFEDYRKRRAIENKIISDKMRGMPFFVSKSLPYKDKDGETVYNTGTYVMGDNKPRNVHTYKVKK